MAFCNTYRFFIAVVTLALSTFAFADGVCYLEQTLPAGSYTITCEGDGIVYNYVTQTNVVVANCEELKISILHELESTAYALTEYGYSYLDDMSNSINVLRHEGANVNALEGDYLSFRGFYDDTVVSFVGEDGNGGLRQYIDENMICGSCSTNSSGGSSGAGSCCNTDLTPILESLNYGHSLTEWLLSTASNVVLQLQYTNFLLDHGFYDVTNKLGDISFNLGIGLSSISNSLNGISSLLYSSRSMTTTYRPYYRFVPTASGVFTARFVQPSFYNPSGYNYLNAISQNISSLAEPILSIANYFYYYTHLQFPVLTNTVGTLTTASTNFFTFFRGEIGVKGVLGDWTANDGTYYDFLTNHYLKVVNGEQIQGSAASKTNWFSRIETLLAALVFADSDGTNTVNTSAGSTEQSQLSSSYATINASAAASSQGFRRNAESIVSLYRRFGTAFDGAALPAHVLLIRATGSDDRVVEIGFDVSSGISVFVESCRLVCTFCWASVGIFLLYRFMVWSINCVVVACRFVYSAVSRLFK